MEFKKTAKRYLRMESREKSKNAEVPDNIMRKCNLCKKAIFVEETIANGYICPKCGGYLRMPAQARLANVIDADSFEEWDVGLENTNPLGMHNYPSKVAELKEKTGLDEAVLTGKAKIGGMDVAIMIMDCRFLTASMGYVVGEKITRGVERATKEMLPVIIFTASGGARMQEGMTSLMQMAKTSAALKRHSKAGLLYITVLTNPTTGGVTASFAMLGDIILAEPEALVGFAGPRVIEQTIGQKLPKGFQRSEFLVEHGFIDRIVARKDMRAELEKILAFHRAFEDSEKSLDEVCLNTDCIDEVPVADFGDDASIKMDIAAGNILTKPEKEPLTAWERVIKSREKDRPVGIHYIEKLFPDFIEMKGDRYYGDDPAICGGMATFRGVPVTVIAQMKGRNTKENIKYNFGMPNPEGYRKALRLMKQADKFHRPIICFVDTPGAYCGLEAEERGQGEAIARNLYEMADLKVPVLSIFIGEGGSGGALALAVANEIWMLENSAYSILSPEGFASILWKDAKLKEKAAEVMKLTANDLFEAGFVEKVIEEPQHYHADAMEDVINTMENGIAAFLDREMNQSEEEIREERYQRFRAM